MPTEDQFAHVNHSLTPHTDVVGYLAEAELEKGLWPVIVKSAYGPLLEVAPLTLSCDKEVQRQWYDCKKGLWPFGEGKKSGRNISPPSSIIAEDETSDVDWYSKLEFYTKQHPALTSCIVPGSGTTPADSIKPGMKFELRSSMNPSNYWGVTVTDNVGGLLGLSYDSPELKPNRDFRLFYFSPHLFPCGTVASGQNLQFSVPASLKKRNYPDQVWKVVKQSFAEIQPDRIAPSWCFSEGKLNPANHCFEERMLLTVIDPNTRNRFRVAIVEKVVDDKTFVISLLEEPEVTIACSGATEEIVPISWAIEHKFLDKASLQTMSCSPLSRIAGRNLFLALNKSSNSFSIGDKIEFCVDPDALDFCLATVELIHGHIMKLSLAAKTGLHHVLVSSGSQSLFPEGWCYSNGIELHQDELPQDVDEIQPIQTSPTKDLVLNTVNDNAWCPPIYFNHLCYSASFLSRHRLESLPRFIGGGPVRLVMREVLSRLIGSSFKSGAVLKKLEVGNRRPRPHFWVETMKGKSRVLLLQADVEIPSRTSQVASFCREVCQKLSCCPYLFGPQLVGAECPSACNSRPKSDFMRTPTESGDGRQKRGVKRGRRKTKGGAPQSCHSSSCSSPSASPTPSTTVTTCTTRENSPSQGSRQLAAKPDSCDVEALQRMLAEECQDDDEDDEESREPSPPPRPPSPKLLRSKSSAVALVNSYVEQMQEQSYSRVARPQSRGELEPAFEVDFHSPCPIFEEPPPIRRITLMSNPLTWNSGEVAAYFEAQEDVAQLGQLFRRDEIDGQALLLLNLPSMLEHWRLKLGEAVRLSRHLESIKLAFYTQFAFEKNDQVETGVVVE